MTFEKKIEYLRVISLNLFLFTNIAILGALFLSNFLTSVKFDYNYKIYKTKINTKIYCNKNNNFCKNIKFEKNQNLSNCPSKRIVDSVYINNKYFGDLNSYREHIESSDFIEEETYFILNTTNKINTTCIKNYQFYNNLNENYPILIKQLLKLKEKRDYWSTGKSIYPFFFGETSISNIAKRFPQNYIFKPALFIASVLMFLYWLLNKKILQTVDNNKIEKYFIFGALSSIFLILHVYFLGDPSENNIFKLFRKLVIILFISFELAAQFFLIQRIKNLKEDLSKLININILKVKIYFVYFFLTITFLIIVILAIFNLPSSFDNFIEWNYFIILSVYYLLTYYLWKKIIP